MRSGLLAVFSFAVVLNVGWGQGLAAPTFTTQPVGTSAFYGDAVTLTATVQGTPAPAVQWFRNDAPLSPAPDAGITLASFTSASGAVTTTLTFGALKLTDGGSYHVVATSGALSVPSLTAPISVLRRPQVIQVTPAAATVAAGSSLTLAATSSAGLPVTLTLVSGAASLNGPLLTGQGGDVVVRGTQPGNENIAAAEPWFGTYSFVSGRISPFITSPPADQTITAGSALTLRAIAIGSPAPTYQWRKDGAILAGATNATLTLAAATPADGGRYTLTATNPAGAAEATATVSVRAAPVITLSPAGRTVFAGDAVTFAAAATGSPAPTFQWRKNGAAVGGATNASLAFASALATDAGRYDVVVTNVLGSATSEAATLVVNTRDFSGAYFGEFGDGAGSFALHVRTDRSAVFLGYVPGQQSALIVLTLRVDLTGNFALETTTIAAASPASTTTPPAPTAAPQRVTVRGRCDEAAGTATGSVPEMGLTFAGTRASRAGAAAAHAGFYVAALIGSASGRGHAVLAADGQAFVLTTQGTAIDAARGTLASDGRLLATTTAQGTLDLAFNNGRLSGTLRNEGLTATLGGAIEARAGTEHLVNLSVRAATSPGAATLITGFVVTGTSPKQVLVRAAGPALSVAPFNIAGAMVDPTLQLFRGATAVGQNDDWNTPPAGTAAITTATARVGAFPFRAGSADAALLTTLQPGAYSVHVGGGLGTALAEVYEVLENNEVPGGRRLVNVSARGLVTPAAPLIAGFVISGTGPQRVLIRGVGPTLATAPFGIPGALSNPQLTLFRGSAVVKTNDDWFRDPEASLIREAAARAGAFALGASSLDAGLLLFLEPGPYTVQLAGPSGANAANSAGLALIEVYEAAP